MLNPNFEKLKEMVAQLLDGSDLYSPDELLEKIRSDEFMGLINGHESDYLIGLLPIDTDVIGDDGKSYLDSINERSGGIGIDNVEFKLPETREIDEFDLIQPNEEEAHFGFEEIINNDNDNDGIVSMSNEDLDFLIELSDNSDDNSEEDDELPESGFLGLL